MKHKHLFFLLGILIVLVIGAVIYQSTSTRVIYASQLGAKLDSDVYAGGGTDDSKALQYGLDLATNYHGYEFVVDGPALISTNLVIRSNTRLRFLPGAGLFVAAHANCWPLGNLQNTNYATTNIEIIGGILNCNGNAQTEFFRGGANHVDPGVWGLWLAGVDGAVLRDVTLISPKTYSYVFTDSRNIYMEHCRVIFTNNPAGTNAIYGNDGLHFMCNLTNIHVNGFQDTAGNDDVFAFNTDETDNTLPVKDPRWTTNSGSIDNVTLENIYLDGTKNIGKFQSYGSTNARAANITLRNIHGRLGSQASQGVVVLSQQFFFSTGDYTVRMPNFTIDGLNVDLPNTWSTLWQALGVVDLSRAAGDRAVLNNIRITDLNGIGMGSPSPGGSYIGLGSDITNVQLANISIAGPLDGSGTSVGDPAIYIAITSTNAAPNAPRISIANLQVKNLATAIDGQANGVIRVVNPQLGSGVADHSSAFTNYVNASFGPITAQTNFLSGIWYTNATGRPQTVQQTFAVIQAAVNGTVIVNFITGQQGAALGTWVTNDWGGQQTLSTSLATTNGFHVGGFVSNSIVWCFTNQIVGAGNSITPRAGTGQLITY